MLEILYHHAKFGGAQILAAAEAAKNVELFGLFNFVCVFVTLMPLRLQTTEVVRMIFALKAPEYRKSFDDVG